MWSRYLVFKRPGCCERYRRKRLLGLVLLRFLPCLFFFPAQTEAFVKDEIAEEAAGVAA